MEAESDSCATVWACAIASNISATESPEPTASLIVVFTAAIPSAAASATALNFVSASPVSPAVEADSFKMDSISPELLSTSKPPPTMPDSFSAIAAAMVELSALASSPLAPAKALAPVSIKFATSVPAALTLTATAANPGSSAFATGSKFRRSNSASRSNALSIALTASSWLCPLDINDATNVVSGVMVIEPTGPFKILVYGKSVDRSVPPNITINASA